jgi:hypothetical protein
VATEMSVPFITVSMDKENMNFTAILNLTTPYLSLWGIVKGQEDVRYHYVNEFGRAVEDVQHYYTRNTSAHHKEHCGTSGCVTNMAVHTETNFTYSDSRRMVTTWLQCTKSNGRITDEY